MKKLILFFSFIFLTLGGLAQQSQGLEAFYDSGKIIYVQNDNASGKDPMQQVERKLAALDVYVKMERTADELEAVRKERESLEQLRSRLQIQSERLVKPLPPMQEIR